MELGVPQLLEFPLAKLVPFTEHPDTIRRGGVASTIKNCAFHSPAHQAYLTEESSAIVIPPSTEAAPGMNVLPRVLLPLAGPEEIEVDVEAFISVFTLVF
jgi:hypothetical protein